MRRGRGVRIRGGLAHTYYIGVEVRARGQTMALCLFPAGVEEGHTVNLTGRTFELRIRRPVDFPLYVSSTRTTDAVGCTYRRGSTHDASTAATAAASSDQSSRSMLAPCLATR